MSKTRRLDRRARLVAQWRASGVSQRAFARRHGIHPRTFWGWCRSSDRDDAARSPQGGVQLVPVTVIEDAAADEVPLQAEVVFATGDRLALRGAVTGDVVAHLVTALRRPC